MSLSSIDLAYLDRLAANIAHRGKDHAKAAFTAYAAAQGWGNTPAWVEGREAFTALWRRYRASFLASVQA
jgi:hypothetical protein